MQNSAETGPISAPVTRIFNPDNDLALGNGDANYQPPRSAKQMAYDLALLPVWYACEGDAVVLPHSELLYYWSKTSRNGLKHPEVEWIIGNEELPSQPVSPWGWNGALVKQLFRRGGTDRWLPEPARLERWRALSHRQTAAEVLDELMTHLGSDESFVGESRVCRNEAEVTAFLSMHHQTIFKAPWSGSGKGLRRGQADFSPPFSGWCTRILNQQGAVIAEPFYKRVKDFAMEFYSQGDGTPLQFCGYSYFLTDENGAYKGNMLMSDEAIENALARYVGAEKLHRLCNVIGQVMTRRFASEYTGYIGVDMMICDISEADGAEKRRYAIHPCVEINLRMNMGVVSHILYERYVSAGKSGLFFVEYHASADALKQLHARRCEEYPCTLSGAGRLSGGYQPLTPIGRTTQFLAGMIVDMP